MSVSARRISHRATTIALALTLTVAGGAPVLAKTGGNAEAAAACRAGGHVNWVDAGGNSFRNTGACVRYAAHGGTLVPVATGPFSVVYTSLVPGWFRATVTGTGLAASSPYELSWVWPDRSVTLNATTGPSGSFVHVQDEQCRDASGNLMTSFTATGTPTGGTETSYTMPTPPASVCP